MNKSLFFGTGLGIALTLLTLTVLPYGVQADQQGEIITKQKTLNLTFNEENPDGNVDLKGIVEEELMEPAECEETMMLCNFKEVSFEITIKKEWHKINLADMNNFDFANSVAPLKNPVDELSDPETVVMQETLARRGLLQHLDGRIVEERGFFGSLTWLALLRLAQVKNLDDASESFHEDLAGEINSLLDRMGQDPGYVANAPLPERVDYEPQVNDPLRDLWDRYYYLARLAQNAKRVDTGNIPLDGSVDVNIDGYVNVERVSQ